MDYRCSRAANAKITAYATMEKFENISPADLEQMASLQACNFANPEANEFYSLCMAAYMHCEAAQRPIVKNHFLMVLGRMKTP